MTDLENLDGLYTLQEVAEGNKNFQILFNRDLARKLYEIELTSQDTQDLKKSFIESGRLGDDSNFYNLLRKQSKANFCIYHGLLLDCRYDKAMLSLRWADIENLYLDKKTNIKYQSLGVKKDKQEKMLKDLFKNYIEFISNFLK